MPFAGGALSNSNPVFHPVDGAYSSQGVTSQNNVSMSRGDQSNIEIVIDNQKRGSQQVTSIMKRAYHKLGQSSENQQLIN